MKCNVSLDSITSCHKKINELLRSNKSKNKAIAESHSGMSHVEGRGHNTGIVCFKSPEQLLSYFSTVIVSALCSFCNSNYSMSSKNS